MDVKQTVDLVLSIIAVLLVVVPYIATLLIHTRNKFLSTIGAEAIKITSALEETDLGGDAKKEAAQAKLQSMFSGSIIGTLIGLKLTPEQFADQVDAAVAVLRTKGIKEKTVGSVVAPISQIGFTTTTTTEVPEEPKP